MTISEIGDLHVIGELGNVGRAGGSVEDCPVWLAAGGVAEDRVGGLFSTELELGGHGEKSPKIARRDCQAGTSCAGIVAGLWRDRSRIVTASRMCEGMVQRNA